MNAIAANGVTDADTVETSELAGPLPFDFREFIEQRLGIDRQHADALLGSYVRAAWDLGRASCEQRPAD